MKLSDSQNLTPSRLRGTQGEVTVFASLLTLFFAYVRGFAFARTCGCNSIKLFFVVFLLRIHDV